MILGQGPSRKKYAWFSSSERASREKCMYPYLWITPYIMNDLHFILSYLRHFCAEIGWNSGCWSEKMVKRERRQSTCIAFNVAICMPALLMLFLKLINYWMLVKIVFLILYQIYIYQYSRNNIWFMFYRFTFA